MPRGGQVEVQRLDLATVVAAGKELHSFPPRHQWDLHLKKAHVLVNNTHFWVLSRWQRFQHSVQGNCWQQQLVYLSFLLWNSSDPKNFLYYAFIINNKVLLCLYSNVPLPPFPPIVTHIMIFPGRWSGPVHSLCAQLPDLLLLHLGDTFGLW